MEKTRIYFAKTKPEAIIPRKRNEDAGYDIFACIENSYIIFQPHQTLKVPTGISSAFSHEYYFQIAERGSTGSLGISQRCGVIDSGYRGEWFLSLSNLNTIPLIIAPESEYQKIEDVMNGQSFLFYNADHAIAQAILLPVPETEIIEITMEEIHIFKSQRGTSSSGSTNKGKPESSFPITDQYSK